MTRAGWFAATALTITVALVVAANAADKHAVTSEWAAAGVAYLGLVGVPGAISAGVARFDVTRIACFVVMTGVAIWAGWAMGSSDDAQAGLAALIVPVVGIPLAGVVLVAEGVAIRRVGVPDPAPVAMGEERAALPERLAALLVDLVLAAAVLVVPLTVLSHRDAEVVAAVIGISGGVAYLSVSWMTKGATIGQALLRLRVLGADGGSPSPVQAIGRASLLVVEVLGTATLLLLPFACIELALAASASGRTLLDRVTRTTVVARSTRATESDGTARTHL